MKVLVTGAYGFLGGRVSKFLSERCAADVVLGARAPGVGVSWLPVATVAQTNWAEPETLKSACHGADAVVHLAGLNAQDCYRDPVLALEVNGLATARLLRAAIESGVQRFLYVSTAHVYGPMAGVITEATCPRSDHPYSTSHRAAEDTVGHATSRGQIDGLVVRLSNGFGAPMDAAANCWTLLVNELCRDAVVTRRLALRSSGQQLRDWIPLDEVCRGIAHLLSTSRATLADDRLFNLGVEWSLSVWQMALLVQDRCEHVLGYRPQLVAPADAPGELPRTFEYRIDALRRSGFEPNTDRTSEIDRLLVFCTKAFS